MDNSLRKSSSLKFDLSDLLFGISYFPTMSLITNRRIYIEKKNKNFDYSTIQQNSATYESLFNKFSYICNRLPKTWLNNIDCKINIENYSPCLTKNLEMTIGMSMKYSNKIIDMLNTKISFQCINNLDNYIDLNANNNSTIIDIPMNPLNFTMPTFENNMTKKLIPCIESSNEIKNTVNEHDESSDNETLNDNDLLLDIKKIDIIPMLQKIWWRYQKIECVQDNGNNTIQLRKWILSQLKNKKEKLKLNTNNICCNIQDNIDNEDQQDSSDMSINNSDTSTTSIDSQLSEQYSEINVKHSLIELDCEELAQTTLTRRQAQLVNKVLEKSTDSPIQSPKTDTSIKDYFRSRCLSESSIESEGSSFIVFQGENESELDETISDSELSSDEESEDYDEVDYQSTSMVHFAPKPEIHKMIKWDFAYRAARKGPWEQIARDRERFHTRIKRANNIINPVLMTVHREKIYQTRFSITN